MDREHIKTLNQMSHSLWGDETTSYEMSESALSSAGLLNLGDERTIERATKMLIERAEKTPPQTLKLNHPFFRMNPIERFLLTALHVEKWPYERICRTLQIQSDLLGIWAWSTRLKFCFEEMKATIPFPRGSGSLGTHCPEFDPSSPWSQRLLDDELLKKERAFLQSHLMVCDPCRAILDRTRRVIFRIEESIPKGNTKAPSFVQSSNRMLERFKIISNKKPKEKTFIEGTFTFFDRSENIFIAVLFLATVAFLIHKL